MSSSITPVITEQPEAFEEVNIQSTQMLWNKDYLIDVDEIDQEHAQIVDKYNELYILMREGKGHEYYAELLAFLKSYVHEHFAHEEQLHKKHNYPLIHEHKKIHEGFKATLTKIYENSSEKASNRELIRISLFIKQWLIHHILIEDKKFGDHIKNAP
jgi:hemerythrin